MAGSAGFGNEPLGAVGLEIVSSTGSNRAMTVAVRSTQRSPGRSATPVGNSPISPIPATTLRLPTHARASATIQADDEPATAGRTASVRQVSSMNSAPAPSSQAATRLPGRRNAPTSPAAQNGSGPTSTQPTPPGLPVASSIATVATSAQPPMIASTMHTTRIGNSVTRPAAGQKEDNRTGGGGQPHPIPVASTVYVTTPGP